MGQRPGDNARHPSVLDVKISPIVWPRHTSAARPAVVFPLAAQLKAKGRRLGLPTSPSPLFRGRDGFDLIGQPPAASDRLKPLAASVESRDRLLLVCEAYFAFSVNCVWRTTFTLISPG